MASSDSFSPGQFAALALFVIVGSCTVGYFIAGGMQHDNSGKTVTVSTPSAPSTDSSTPTPQSTTSSSTPSTKQASKPDGNYTAPNAPKIEISEEKAPPPPPTTPSTTEDDSQTASNDTEASQESDNSSSSTPDTGTVGTVPSPVTGNATTPSPSTQTSDQDYEQTGSKSDSESSQEGSASESGRARFRVQVGTFAQAMNARSLADALRNRGYNTTTVADHDSDKTVYHVQTGAYSSRTAADQATLQLKRDGYPAFVTPITE